MDTFRDSAVGKLVRVFSNRSILTYPEERSPAACEVYIRRRRTSHDDKAIEAQTLPSTDLALARSETHGLYTVTTQVSQTLSRADSASASTSDGETVDMIVGWSGPDDAENPHNWSTGKKLFVSTEICLLTFAVYLGSAIYSPGIPGVSEEFGVSNVAGTIGLTLFVLGYGVGPMLWSPLTELPGIGRSPVYVLTLLAFIGFQFGVVYATNFGMLMAFRFLTGFVGSPALAVGGASLGDIWSPQITDYAIGIWGMFAISAPLLGPVIGGFVFSAKGWRWPMWVLLWLTAAVFVLLVFCLPETSGPNILTRRAARVRKTMGKSEYRSEGELELKGMGLKNLLVESLTRPFILIFTEPIVLLMDIYVALIYGILYIYFEAFPIIFEEIHGFNPGQDGLAFMGIMVGTIITIAGYFSWKHFVQSKYFDSEGRIAPEYQLPPACFGCFSLPLALFTFGWTGNYESVPWIVPIILSSFFAVGGCLVFNCVFCYQAHAYPRYAASVLAGNDFIRSTFGAGFPLFATAMFHNLGVGWACTLLGFLTVLFIPYPFFLYKYGKRIRMASKYARH